MSYASKCIRQCCNLLISWLWTQPVIVLSIVWHVRTLVCDAQSTVDLNWHLSGYQFCAYAPCLRDYKSVLLRISIWFSCQFATFHVANRAVTVLLLKLLFAKKRRAVISWVNCETSLQFLKVAWTNGWGEWRSLRGCWHDRGRRTNTRLLNFTTRARLENAPNLGFYSPKTYCRNCRLSCSFMTTGQLKCEHLRNESRCGHTEKDISAAKCPIHHFIRISWTLAHNS